MDGHTGLAVGTGLEVGDCETGAMLDHVSCYHVNIQQFELADN